MNQRNPHHRRISAKIAKVVVVISLWVLAVGSLSARPKTLGVQLAIPIQTVRFSSIDSLAIRSGSESTNLTLTIDTSGKVTALSPTGAMAVEQLRGFKSYFSRVAFSPAIRDDKKIVSRLVVQAVLAKDTDMCTVNYPISVDSSIREGYYYLQSLNLNGVTPATWKQFPWFHADLQAADTTYLLKYALISLGLTAKGAVTHAELVGTNYPGFAEQVTNAAKWGSYLPAKRGIRKIASENLLLISFFPSISYPTKPLVAAKLDTAGWHERFLVRMLPDTFGLLTVPIPRQTFPANFQIPIPKVLISRPILMICEVDSVGKVHVKPIGIDSIQVSQVCAKFSEQIRFFPAMDFRGRPVPFEGLARLEVLGEANVRIQYLWLH